MVLLMRCPLLSPFLVNIFENLTFQNTCSINEVGIRWQCEAHSRVWKLQCSCVMCTYCIVKYKEETTICTNITPDVRDLSPLEDWWMISSAFQSQIVQTKAKQQLNWPRSDTRKALSVMTGLLGEPRGRLRHFSRSLSPLLRSQSLVNAI